MPLVRPERRKLLILGILLFGQVLLISVQIPLGTAPSYLERAVFAVLSPVQKAVRAVFAGVGGAWTRYVYLRRVEAQNRTLRDELFHLRQENLRLRDGLAQLRDREAADRFLSGLGRSFTVAAVIGVDASNIYESIVIDKGRSDGLGPNQAVVDAVGNLVGRTIEPISAGQATVELITGKVCSVGVVSEKAGTLGILSGEGASGLCLLKYILATDASLAEKEALATSGTDRIYPPGLRVGRIVKIERDRTLFKKVVVQPDFDFRRLRVVAVLAAAGSPGKAPR